MFPFSRYKVYGHSMLPALKFGQDILCFNWAYLFSQPKVGDVVVINHQGREIVKRVQMSSDRGTFVLGDNHNESMDSRNFGPVKNRDILGKVIWFG